MSHTDKDRPLWVKRNDASLLRYTDHNHLILGKPIIKRRYLLNEDGERYKVPYTYTRLEFDWIKAERFGYFDKNLSQSEREEFKLAFRDELYSEVKYESEIWAYEDVVVGYAADSCTEGEPVNRENRHFWDPTLPCQPELTLEHGYYSGWHSRPGVQKVNRRIMRGGERVTKRDTLISYAKEVNSNGLAEDDLEQLNDDRAPIGQRPKYWLDWD